MFRGTVKKVDKKTFTCFILKEGLEDQIIPARMAFSYCNSASKSGFYFLPKIGSKVIFQQVIENGKPYGWILTYNSGDVSSRDFFINSTDTSQNPGIEMYLSPQDVEFNNQIVEDQGFELGDMVIRGSKGNKLKITEDGGTLLKCTPVNFIYMSPLNNRLYQWSQNSLIRTPGSFNGEFNIVTTISEKSGSFHYAVKRHFVNPIEQQLTIQEEWGLVDKITKATAGDYGDVPNSLTTKASASIANNTDEAKRSTLSGYNVYKRKIFDFGGRGETKTPESSNNEYYTEEIKADGAYRVRIGKKTGAAPKDINGVEVLYAPDGTWSVGSQWGKITVSKTDMLLSTSTFEISLSNLMLHLMNHTHLAVGSPTTPPIATPTPPGMATAYAAVESKIPDPRLFWNT